MAINLPYFSAIIFDMDGLVLETEPSYLAAWKQAAQIMGYSFTEMIGGSLLGLEADAVENYLSQLWGADFNLKHFQQLSRDYWYDYIDQHGIEKKYGVDELLAVVNDANLPYCLATNSKQKNAIECLSLAGLQHDFNLIISRDLVKHGKPEPDIFLQAADALQHPIKHCLILEDSAIGIKAAQQAGGIPWLIPSPSTPIDTLEISSAFIFNHLAEVAKIIMDNYH
jgi:HAD superfamily hydrolase (TIGR01509 family)